jgi:type I restriction enzyme S subunit
MKIEDFQFPSAWKLCSVAESFDFTAKPRGLDLTKNGNQIPFFTMDQIRLGRIHVSECTLKPLSELGSGTYVENGDLMVAKITPSFENGKQAIVNIENDFAYATTEVIPMRGRKGKSNTLFLFFYLLHPEVRSDLAGKMEGSTGRQRLSKTVLGNRLIPIPPLPEQKKIAHILSTVQRAIEAQERIIQTTTELKKALMHKLFTEGLRHEPQKQTEVGPIPESWEVVALGGFAQAKAGFGFPMNRQGKVVGKYPFYKVSDMNLAGNEKHMGVANNWIDEDDLTALKAKLFPCGTIIFPKIGATILTNKKRLLSRPSVVDNNVVGILIEDQEICRSEYLYQWFQTVDLGKLANPGTVPSITSGKLHSTLVPLPPAGEQADIASALCSIDGKLRQHASRKSALQDLFRTLLHELMTAKTRVHHLDTPC